MTATEQIIIPKVNSFEQIINNAKEKTAAKPLRAALVEPGHANVFEALAQAMNSGLITPVIIGEEDTVRKAAKENNFNLNSVDLHSPQKDFSPVQTAVRMAEQGEVDIIIKGTSATDQFMKGLFSDEVAFVKKGKLISHIAVMKPAKYPKLLLLTDAFVTIAPDLKQKIALINNLIYISNKIGIDMPRIAVLAAVEVVYPQMPVTIDGAVLAKMSGRKQIKGGYVDGPLSFDCAIEPVAAKSKGISDSEVAGQADALLAPNIETAYGIYQAMALYGQAQMGGVLVNGCVPVALAARSDSRESIFHSIVLATLVR